MYPFISDSFCQHYVCEIRSNHALLLCLFSILSITPFYEDATIYLSILILVAFSLALSAVVLLGTFLYVIWWTCVCISVGYRPKREISGSLNGFAFRSWCQTFLRSGCSGSFLLAQFGDCGDSTSLPTVNIVSP